MNAFLKKQPIFYYLITIFAIWMGFYYLNLNLVPFHPDESTQIFMSDDVDLFFSEPSSLFYSKKAVSDQKQSYRFLDSPITRYTIGFWRFLTNQPALKQDWNWSANWNDNQSAIPNPSLLFFARLGVSLVFPFSVLLLFLITRRLFSIETAVFAGLLFMFNAVILLHTRRAMAESLMLFFMLLSIWLIYIIKPHHFYLTAIPIAFAINTKQSLLFLIPASIFIYLIRIKISWSAIKQLIFSLILIILITVSLNPVLWNRPIEAARIMVDKRAALLESQLEVIHFVSPEFILDTPFERLVGFIAQTFITPPAYQDVANYQDYLEPSIQRYEQNLFHQGIFRSVIPGVIFFVLSIIGFIIVLLDWQKDKIGFLVLFLLALGEILYAFPIPFQRYYLPLYPFIFILIAIFFTKLLNGIKQFTTHSQL
jgi:4-amino-4-deoxy-L-arabinose transferase-like glycosyltransferase